MNLDLRVVVVGLGSIGRRHLRLLHERPGLRLEVVEPCESMLELARQDVGPIEVHDDYQRMLATAPDIVWLATPTPLHAAQAVQALEAGCHVFCEKPMSDRLDAALRMVAAAERCGRILNIGYYLHFWKCAARLRQLIREGDLGQILHAHARVGSYITLVNSVSRYQMDNPGSLLLDYSHQTDLMCWWLGQVPCAVTAAALSHGALEWRPAPNVIDLILHYRQPLISHIHLNYVQMPERHQYEIAGDRGWASADFLTGRIVIGNRRTSQTVTEDWPQQRDDIFREEHQAFFDTVAGRRPPETGPAEGLNSVAVFEAAMASWESGARLEVNTRVAVPAER